MDDKVTNDSPLVETVRIKEEPKKDAVPEFKIDKDTVLYLIYLLYKANMLTNMHLKSFLSIIEAPLPDNVAKFIVEEAAKA